MDEAIRDMLIIGLQVIGGLAVGALSIIAERSRRESRKDREHAAKLQAARDTIDGQRHAAVVVRLDRIDQNQAETRDEIKALHERDNQLAVEIERRAARIEGHLGMHSRTHEGRKSG